MVFKYFFLCFVLLLSCTKKRVEQNGLKVLNQVSEPIQNFDPHLTTGLATVQQLGKLYEGLVEAHPFDSPFGILPNLAKELPKISDDGKTYTFHLRKGVLYHQFPSKAHEGRTVKAEDFVTTFKRIADPKLITPHYEYWKKRVVGLEEFYQANKNKEKVDYSIPLKGVKALDEYTLQIEIPERNDGFIYSLSSPRIAPLPLEALMYFKNDLTKVELGTGPFVLHSYSRGNRIEYFKNKSYREKLFPEGGSTEYVGRPVPFLDKIVVKIIKEANTAWLTFLKGELDYLEVPKDNFSQTFTPNLALTAEMQEKGIQLGITPALTNVYYFGFNLKDKYTSNIHLRKAIAYAFDKDRYNELFFNNTADIASTIIPPNIPGNTPPLKSPYLKKNLEKAKVELKLAGYPNGVGLPELSIVVKNKTLSRQVGEFLKKELAEIGIRVKVEAVSWTNLLDKVQRSDFTMFYLAWFVGVPSAYEFFELVYGPNHPSSYNRVGYQNKKFDKLFDISKKEANKVKKEKMIREMNEITLRDLPVLPLIHTKNFFLYQKWLKNYVPSQVDGGGLEQYFDIVK